MNSTTNIHNNLFGNIRYIAPEIFKSSQVEGPNKNTKDLYTKYSDVFSLGVLLWQISSGKPPFESQNEYLLFVTVMSGSKERRIPNTPDEYYKLYNECWDDKPEQRHT